MTLCNFPSRDGLYDIVETYSKDAYIFSAPETID